MLYSTYTSHSHFLGYLTTCVLFLPCFSFDKLNTFCLCLLIRRLCGQRCSMYFTLSKSKNFLVLVSYVVLHPQGSYPWNLRLLLGALKLPSAGSGESSVHDARRPDIQSGLYKERKHSYSLLLLSFRHSEKVCIRLFALQKTSLPTSWVITRNFISIFVCVNQSLWRDPARFITIH